MKLIGNPETDHAYVQDFLLPASTVALAIVDAAEGEAIGAFLLIVIAVALPPFLQSVDRFTSTIESPSFRTFRRRLNYAAQLGVSAFGTYLAAEGAWDIALNFFSAWG